MGWKSGAYSGFLLILLLIAGFFAGRGSVQSVINEGDVHLEANAHQYILGDKVILQARLEFAHQEQAAIRRVTLAITGSHEAGIDLPLAEGVHTLAIPPELGDELHVTVSHAQIDLLPIPTGTPGGRFKGIYHGAGTGAAIDLSLQLLIGESLATVGDYEAELIVNFGEGPNLNQSGKVQYSILPGKCGDYNLDHAVNAFDAVIYFGIAAQFVMPDTGLMISTDIDGDGMITHSDASTVIERVVNSVTPVGCAS